MTHSLVLAIAEFWAFEFIVEHGRYDLAFPRHVCSNRLIWGT